MPKINDRLDRLEKLDPHRGCRPPRMNIEQFVAYWTHLPGPQLGIFLRAMNYEDLEASTNYLQGAVAAEEEQQHGNS